MIARSKVRGLLRSALFALLVLAPVRPSEAQVQPVPGPWGDQWVQSGPGSPFWINLAIGEVQDRSSGRFYQARLNPQERARFSADYQAWVATVPGLLRLLQPDLDRVLQVIDGGPGIGPGGGAVVPVPAGGGQPDPRITDPFGPTPFDTSEVLGM